MILTVTPNLAVDVTYTVDRLVPRRTHRATTVTERAGGKGVNVARVLRRLDHEALIVGPAGGANGDLIRSDLTTSGLPHALTTITGHSRRTIALVSTEDGDATMVNEPGPELTGREWAELCARVNEHAPAASAVVLAGSLPRGVPADGYAQLIDIATTHAVATVLDTSGEALRHGVAAGPTIVKPNADELHDLTGTTDPLAGAQVLRDYGANVVVVSCGPDGMFAITEEQVWRAYPGERVDGNPTGAGDAAVAALASGLGVGSSWPQRLSDAVALSAAAVATPLAGDYDPDHYQHQRLSVRLEEIHAPRVHR